MTETYDFFISFSNRDVERVTEIVGIMEKYKANCWFQKKDSRLEYAHAIMSGIKNSKTFVVLLSQNSADSMYVLNEIRCAIDCYDKNRSYKILPVIIDDSDLADEKYEQVNFYLGRLNMLFAKEFSTTEELVFKIFEQSDFELVNDATQESTYMVGEREGSRLSAQNRLLSGANRNLIDDILEGDSLILDVGCSSGDSIAPFLERLSYGGLLGIDTDAKKIGAANEKYGSDKNTFTVCNVNDDAFPDLLDDYLDRYDARGFDLIYISFLLLHLANPVKLLRTLKRYLSKNGILYIQDIDDGMSLAYPNTDFFDKAFYLWEQSKESGDRYCGRKIPGYLSEAGYGNARVLKCGISNLGLDEQDKQTLWDLYFNYELWEVDDYGVFRNPGKCGPMYESYKKEYAARKKEYDDGNIFIQLGFVFFMAKK